MIVCDGSKYISLVLISLLHCLMTTADEHTHTVSLVVTMYHHVLMMLYYSSSDYYLHTHRNEHMVVFIGVR